MKKHRIYVDTSVIGGCCDPEFETWSRGLLRDFQEGTFRVVISEIVEREIASAPDEVKDYYLLFLEYATDVIEVDMEANELAEAYIRHRILPRSFIDDARHIRSQRSPTPTCW
jgi:hypothetical protein